MPSIDGVYKIRPLRVLIANERQDRLITVKAIVESLGHEVITPQIEVEDVGAFTREELPDVALVGLGDSEAHALDLIERIVFEAVCPVVALLHLPDPEFIAEAARRGIFAYATADDPGPEWQNAIEVALRRFAQLHDLENAFAKRAITEQARGKQHRPWRLDRAARFPCQRQLEVGCPEGEPALARVELDSTQRWKRGARGHRAPDEPGSGDEIGAWDGELQWH